MLKSLSKNLPLDLVINMLLLPAQARMLIFAAALRYMILALKRGMKLLCQRYPSWLLPIQF